MSYYITGYGSIETKLLGKIYREQLYLPNSDRWLLRRISPYCENNCDNDFYNINTSFRSLIVILPMWKMQEVFRIICPKCSETIELEMEEFRLIKPFIDLNKLYETGKIDETEYKNRLYKIEAKLLKLKRE